jgi:anti-sigma factor RsiW
MNRVSFGEGACERTRKYLDSYISNELLVETNHEVLRHLEVCPACAGEADSRARLRTRLQTAVETQPVPAELAVRVRERIREHESRSAFGLGWNRRWAMALAPSACLAVALWLNPLRDRIPDYPDRPSQNAYIQRVSSTVGAILRVGLGDHIHCAIYRKGPRTASPVAKMESDLGPQFKGLVPVVNATIPKGYRIVVGHQCSYLGRKFVHLTLEKDGDLLSLVIARKQEGESLAGLGTANQHSGIPVYQAAAGPFQVAAFDAGNFLAYVVSDLKPKSNLQVAAALAPGVRDFLLKTTA